MTVNVSILVERAKAFSKKYGVPITKNQFEGTLDDPVPELPYMVWLSSHETGRGADGFNNLKAQDVDFELYTQQDNQERDEECFQTAYEVRGLLTKTKGVNRA